MRIIVTGSNGFIGSAICKKLMAHNFHVIGLDIAPIGNGVTNEYYQIDISDIINIDRISSEISIVDCIIHTAAILDSGMFSPNVIQVNCLGTQNILRLAQYCECKQLIYISGVTVIGIPKVLPITEEHPLNPQTVYHATKLFGEYIVNLAPNTGISTTTLRLTAPIGANMPSKRMLYQFIGNCMAGADINLYGKGTRKQNYVDVRDVASAVYSVIKNKAVGIYNIAGQTSYMNLELANKCKAILKSSSKIKFIESPDPQEGENWSVSIDKARQTFGYQPLYSIEDTIKDIALGIQGIKT